MRTLKEIKTLLKRHKEELRKRFKVKEIGIFGSFVRGESEENGRGGGDTSHIFLT